MDDSDDIDSSITDIGDLSDNFITPSGGTSVANSTSTAPNNNSLFAALAGDATKVGTAVIGAQVAEAGLKANPLSATTLIIVVGGIAALILVAVLLKD